MASPKKLSPEDLRIDNENGNIWNRVCMCEHFGTELKDFLKAVDYGERKYTSIDAYVQIRKATEIFGPMGSGWGVKNIFIIGMQPVVKATKRGNIDGTLAMFKGTFWFANPESGLDAEFEVMDDIFLDSSGDSCKKVLTSMITKSLSYLGWNYDVFRGRFNDVKTFESEASEEEKAALLSLISKIKPEVASGIKAYHDKRGWLRGDVQADIKKISDAMNRKKEKTDAEGGQQAAAETGGSGTDPNK